MDQTTSYYVTLNNPTVAQVLLRYLQLEGVRKIFGVPGGALMELLNTMREQADDFEYIVCRQETGAAYIADGYARVSGTLGVVVVTSGPGATNAVTGTMNAQNSGSALLTITGEVPEQYFGKGYLQEGIDAALNIEAIYSNASGYSATITSPTNFTTLFTQALRDALTLPHRAAHISLPNDVAHTPMGSVRMPNKPSNYRAVPRHSDPETTRLAFDALLRAQKPLLFLGNGCREALQRMRVRRDMDRLEKLTALVERFAIPVMTTPDAKGIFPESHALSLRNYGMAGCMWPQQYMGASGAPDHYDALMVMGSSLGQLATNMWDATLVPNGPLMQIDLDSAVIARDFPVEFGIIAEIGHVIDDLYAYGMSLKPGPEVETRRQQIAQIKQTSPFYEAAKRDSGATPILPQTLMGALNAALPDGSHIFVDAGNCVGWSLHYLEIDPPTRFHSALSMGPMGFGVGAVIGAKIAAPQSACVGIVGDGAFMMHGNEVSTAAQNGIGAIWLVLNDNDLAMVSQGMNHFFPVPGKPDVWKDYYQIGNPDLVKFAEAMGAQACEARSPQEARDALTAALLQAEGGRPQVIVVNIATAEVPPYYIAHPAAPAAEPTAPVLQNMAVVRSVADSLTLNQEQNQSVT